MPGSCSLLSLSGSHLTWNGKQPSYAASAVANNTHILRAYIYYSGEQIVIRLERRETHSRSSRWLTVEYPRSEFENVDNVECINALLEVAEFATRPAEWDRMLTQQQKNYLTQLGERARHFGINDFYGVSLDWKTLYG